jgi:hypothetical protein
VKAPFGYGLGGFGDDGAQHFARNVYAWMRGGTVHNVLLFGRCP